MIGYKFGRHGSSRLQQKLPHVIWSHVELFRVHFLRGFQRIGRGLLDDTRLPDGNTASVDMASVTQYRIGPHIATCVRKTSHLRHRVIILWTMQFAGLFVPTPSRCVATNALLGLSQLLTLFA